MPIPNGIESILLYSLLLYTFYCTSFCFQKASYLKWFSGIPTCLEIKHCGSVLLMVNFLLSLFKRKSEREIFMFGDFLLSSSFLNVCQSQEWTRMKMGGQTQSDSLMWMAELGYLSHHLLSPRMCVSRKLDEKWIATELALWCSRLREVDSQESNMALPYGIMRP